MAALGVRALRLGASLARSRKASVCGGLYSAGREVSSSSEEKLKPDKQPLKKPKTPQGRFDEVEQPSTETDPLQRFPDGINPVTKERGGPRGLEPTRYGDWERKVCGN
ncbi:succinate dehydrogenase assembly factor 4, mitochondrial [Rhinatrema bivittatum]|uniref:succinate dehydrogenase assembly factor 4, mitochondrial n=1 Tax=Rhinatrema bivittatum TaxID=194408 RepID=UPI00112C9077|nr:succinate dehydrogenase assembly factor 4, mitochondrial [Rhinatrema bivittatum]